MVVEGKKTVGGLNEFEVCEWVPVHINSIHGPQRIYYAVVRSCDKVKRNFSTCILEQLTTGLRLGAFLGSTSVFPSWIAPFSKWTLFESQNVLICTSLFEIDINGQRTARLSAPPQR